MSQEPGNQTPPQLSPSVGQAAYTAGVPGGSLDVQHLIMQADARRRQRSNDNYFEDVPRSKLERQMAQVSMVRRTGLRDEEKQRKDRGGRRPGRINETIDWCCALWIFLLRVQLCFVLVWLGSLGHWQPTHTHLWLPCVTVCISVFGLLVNQIVQSRTLKW